MDLAPVIVRASSLLSLCCLLACSSDAPTETFEELSPGPRLGKADNAGVAGLDVTGDYAATTAWEVENQWEDTDTPAAREAGVAWPADSGLTWDEKYARWIDALAPVDGEDGPTFAVTNPWGKSVPAAKLDCADLALSLRASFAAWYRLPFYVVSYDGSTPVYFGHFGIRTAGGRWKDMPRFAVSYDDHTALGAAALADWPRDEGLRTLGVQPDDDQPFLEEGARTGAWLDELHLDKRAARMIRLLLVYNGSGNLADARNTYNLVPEAIRPGDVNLHRWQANGIGHTMLAMDVEALADGRIDVRLAESSLPPVQPWWLDATGSALRLTDAHAGGEDDDGDYAKFRGGLKRFRVAKKKAGKWINTWMAADEAAWVDSSDLEAIRARPETFAGLLGEVAPEDKIEALLGIIERKRAHLRDFPASCAARTAREDAFDMLYTTADEFFGLSRAEVDAQWRIEEDYIFAELVYAQSKTCCWNSSNRAMYETILEVVAERQAQAQACESPLVFKAVDGGYDDFAAHDPMGWVAWSADEACPQADVLDDVETTSQATPYCEWAAPADGGSCADRCGGPSDACWCDAACAAYGDCCDDYGARCG